MTTDQYRDSRNLQARIDLHLRFSTNRYGWHRWVFDRLLEVPDDSTLLEAGCGPGHLWKSEIHRAPPRWRLILSDLSPGMVGEARDSLDRERIRYLVADVGRLPIADDSLDAVVANHMLYIPRRPAAAVAEIARVLRPGGLLFAATNGRSHLQEVDDLLGEFGLPRWLEPHIEVFGLETGPAMLDGGFTGIRVDRYPDTLEVTEAEPLIEYLRSMTTFWPAVLEASREEDLRRRVEEIIAEEGAMTIRKDAGLIRAVKR